VFKEGPVPRSAEDQRLRDRVRLVDLDAVWYTRVDSREEGKRKKKTQLVGEKGGSGRPRLQTEDLLLEGGFPPVSPPLRSVWLSEGRRKKMPAKGGQGKSSFLRGRRPWGGCRGSPGNYQETRVTGFKKESTGGGEEGEWKRK